MADHISSLDIAARIGIDLALTEGNLRWSFEQRVLQHQAALDLAPEIQRVGRRLRERSAGAPAASR